MSESLRVIYPGKTGERQTPRLTGQAMFSQRAKTVKERSLEAVRHIFEAVDAEEKAANVD